MPTKFKVNDLVRVVNCSHITGLTGTILGVSSRHGPVAFMIVLLDVPLPSGQKAITVIDSCLELLETELTKEEAMHVYCTWLEEQNARYVQALRDCASCASYPALVTKTVFSVLDTEKE